MKSCGCREHQRTTENAQDEILHNLGGGQWWFDLTMLVELVKMVNGQSQWMSKSNVFELVRESRGMQEKSFIHDALFYD